MKPHIGLIVILSLCVVKVSAQHGRLFGTADYGSEELSSYLINQICQDSHGFIWVATDYGLNKLDGARVTQYVHNRRDTTSILSNNVRTLMLDDGGRLWVGFNNGLQVYQTDADAFRTVQFPHSVSPHITDIAELHDGEIWVITSGWGVFSIDPGTLAVTYLSDITDLTGMFSSHIYEDRFRNVWIGVEREGLVRIAPDKEHAKLFRSPEIPHNAITGIVEDPSGRLYVGTPVQIARFNHETQTFMRIEQEQSPYIRTLIITSNGKIYVGSHGQGLWYIDDHEILRPVTNLGIKLDHRAARIHALWEDRDQNLWLGWFRKGLLVVPAGNNQFDHWRILDREPHEGASIMSILTDSEGVTWCGIDKEGIFQLDRQGRALRQFTEVTDIASMLDGPDNTLWVCTHSKGLGRMDKQTGQFQFLAGPYGGYMKDIVQGNDNHLYISTFGAGFVRYDIQTGQYRQYSITRPMPGMRNLDNDWINTILRDSRGLIWFGHYKGVSCYDPERETFVRLYDDSALDDEICISLLEGKDGRIWAGTYSGIYAIDLDARSVKNYSAADGLSSNVICGLAQDEAGDIWCSTFKGISKLTINEGRFVNHYSGNGLVDRIYNRGIYFQDESRRVFFAGISGVTTFLPNEIRLPEYDKEVMLTSLYVDSRSVNGHTLSGGKLIVGRALINARELRFAYADNTFALEFSTMDFKDPENIRYEYRLKELSDAWSSVTPGTSRVTYNHLNPGQYMLEVRASKYGAYSPIKQFQLTVAPPWHRSNWAYMGYFLGFVLIGALVADLLRRRRVAQINQSKLQLFTDISHEIRSPLTLVVNPLEKLLGGQFDVMTHQTLHGAYRNASRILALVNQLLDIRKFDQGQMKLCFSDTDLVGFIKEVIAVFDYHTLAKKITCRFEHADPEIIVWIDRNNFDKVLINLLSNAYKYTPDGGEIVVSLALGESGTASKTGHQFAEISVTDSGIGLDKSDTEKIFERFYQGLNRQTTTSFGSGIGLNLAKHLVKRHHGTIWAANRTDAQGSCFTVRIPLGKEHLKKEDLAGKPNVESALPEKGALLASKPKPEKAFKRKTNYTVLIVDDDAEIRDFLVQELHTIYKTVIASNGAEGLLIAASQLPDLILSDVRMPHMDGFEFLKRSKRTNTTSHIPIILLTSKMEFEDRMVGLGKGADAYLTKPFKIDELLVIANNLIMSRRTLKGKFSGAQDQEARVKPVAFKSSDEMLMERIMGIVNEEISNPELNVEMLVSKVGLSRVQLHRKLKELTGISTSEFIRNIRLKQAATLLAKKQMNISQVAYAMGFTSQAHFSTVFKKTYGLSPSDYIARHQENDHGMM